MTDPTPASVIVGTALTLAMVQAGMPLFIGFVVVGTIGALVGHARWTLDRERKDPLVADVPIKQHVCMILRAWLMAQFVTMILFLVWTEQGWAWTWGLILGAISSVFASDAIELMWVSIQTRMKKMFGS